MTRRWLLWIPLLAFGAWLALFGDKSPAGDAPALSLPVRAQPAPIRTTATASEPVIRLVPREELIAEPSDPALAQRGRRDLFSTRSWNPPAPVEPVVVMKPTAPPIPFTLLGKKHEGAAWEVYLARGEETFIAREGQVLDATYRVDKIEPPSLMLTYLPLGQAQTLAIGDSR